MRRIERRSGTERRVLFDRRLVNDPTYPGPQRRKVFERRSGLDRRQNQ